MSQVISEIELITMLDKPSKAAISIAKFPYLRNAQENMHNYVCACFQQVLKPPGPKHKYDHKIRKLAT